VGDGASGDFCVALLQMTCWDVGGGGEEQYPNANAMIAYLLTDRALCAGGHLVSTSSYLYLNRDGSSNALGVRCVITAAMLTANNILVWSMVVS
jgi:hypothetical protein